MSEESVPLKTIYLHPQFSGIRSGFNTPTIKVNPTFSYSLGDEQPPSRSSYDEIIFFGVYCLKNSEIVSYDGGVGGRTFTVEGFVTDESDITTLQALTYPTNVIETIDGKQYATSRVPKRSLWIYNSSGSYEQIKNCLLVKPMSVDRFGLNYIYSVKVVESYHD